MYNRSRKLNDMCATDHDDALVVMADGGRRGWQGTPSRYSLQNGDDARPRSYSYLQMMVNCNEYNERAVKDENGASSDYPHP